MVKADAESFGGGSPHLYLPEFSVLGAYNKERMFMKKNCSTKWYWITAVSLFMVMMFNCGVGYYSLSLMVDPIAKSFGVTSGDMALIYTFYGVGSFAAAALLHKSLKFIKLNHLILFGGVISCVGYLLYAFAEYQWMLYLGGTLIGASTVFAGTATVQLAIARWFHEKRSMITGLVASASGLGAAAGSPVVGYLIRSFGWRTACMLIFSLVLVFVCIQVIFLLREQPDSIGLLPYGLQEGSVKAETPQAVVSEGVSLREVCLSVRFLLFVLGLAVTAVTYQTITLYQSSFLLEKGFSAELAATCLSVFAIIDMSNKAAAGVLADRWGFRMVSTYCGVALVGAFLLIRVIDSAVGAVFFSALLGFWPTILVLYGVTVSINLFGKKYLSEYISFTQIVMCCTSFVGMPIIRSLYNSVGSFDPIMDLLLGIVVVFLVVMNVLLRPANSFERYGKENCEL